MVGVSEVVYALTMTSGRPSLPKLMNEAEMGAWMDVSWVAVRSFRERCEGSCGETMLRNRTTRAEDKCVAVEATMARTSGYPSKS